MFTNLNLKIVIIKYNLYYYNNYTNYSLEFCYHVCLYYYKCVD